MKRANFHCSHSSPTRLIDLGTSAGITSLHLINTYDLGEESVRYPALSYCWGRSMPDEGKTMLATLGFHLRGLELHKLPKTIQDTIYVPRKLGIPYLWVDALCIVQDLKKDWEREAATMGQVYSKAYLTISSLPFFGPKFRHIPQWSGDTESDFLKYFRNNPLLARG